MMLVYILLVLVGSVAVIGGMINIQWVDGDEWRKRGDERVESIRRDPAHRGNIYSSDGKLLATTMPVCDLYLDLGCWEKRDKSNRPVLDSLNRVVMEHQIADSNFNRYLPQVCQILHKEFPEHSVSYYQEKILTERAKRRPNRCFLVQRGIGYSAWMAIRALEGWRAGVVPTIQDEGGERSVIHQVRAHIYGNLAENTIGFRNSRAENTYTGLEGFYDSILRGQDGQYRYRRLTKGVWLETNNKGLRDYDSPNGITLDSTKIQPKIDGKDIISTIDTRYQDIAESSLRKALRDYGGTSGCAILMEIKTGYVLACCNLSVDTARHDFREVVDNNIACSDLYEPGSTFKSVILTAMMNDPSFVFDTAERVRVGVKRFTKRADSEINDGSHSKIDTVSVPKALAMSSNVGMCELGWKYYRNRREVLRDSVMSIFPYKPLYLDLKVGESKGGIIDLGPDRNFLNFCYGYANKVSAMQMITFYNAIAAGGRMVKPLFCKAIGTEGKFRQIEPVVLKESICDPQTAKVLKEMLVGVVENGTGNNIKNNTYGIAGKTGTAVYSYSDQHRYSASFVGFFPSEQPKYTCMVVVKNVAAHGRQAAAPVFKKIADCVVAIDKDLSNIVLNANPDTLFPAPKALAMSRTEAGMVPDCTGMTIRQASHELSKAGLRMKFDGYGKVTKQSPKAGTPIKKNETVILKLGK